MAGYQQELRAEAEACRGAVEELQRALADVQAQAAEALRREEQQLQTFAQARAQHERLLLAEERAAREDPQRAMHRAHGEWRERLREETTAGEEWARRHGAAMSAAERRNCL